MKIGILKIFFITLILVSNLFSFENTLKIGILYEKLFTSKKEANIGMKLWLKQMKDLGYDNIEGIFYKKEEKLIDDYKRNKIHIIVSDAMLYYGNKETIDEFTNTKWIMSRSKTMFTQYYLLKNRKSNIKIENSEKVNYVENMGKVWLEMLFYKNNKKTNITFEKIEKPKKLIFNIFFNKNDVSIVSKDLYDSMVSINPQIAEKVEILEKSKPIFFTSIGFRRKQISKEFEEMANKMAEHMTKNKTSFAVISFISVQKVYMLRDGDLNDLDKFYKEYLKAKKSYKWSTF